jgi:tyrosine decarboxylase/aspartate 1-decarboxylase
MNNKGLPRRTVIELIKKNLKEDLTYNSGRIFGSMCSIPNDFAKRIYIQSMEKNLGDAGLHFSQIVNH